MIKFITGLPGSGKTYYLAKTMIEILARRGEREFKREIFSNVKLNLEKDDSRYHYLPNNDVGREMLKARDGVIFLDEGQIWFNSRYWESLDADFQYKLGQHRHERLDFVLATQNEARIDVLMRELVGEFYHCKKIIGSNDQRLDNLNLSSEERLKRTWGLIKVSEYWPEDMKKKDGVRQSISSEFFFLKKDIMLAYDSYAKNIKPDSIKKHLHMVYDVCDVCAGAGKKLLYKKFAD